jgi:hypothetical protein
MCKATGPFVNALIAAVNGRDPPPGTYDEILTIIGAVAEQGLRSSPHDAGHGAAIFCILETVFCSVCFKLREQLPPGQRLVCCPKCLWGWCCQEHWKQFAPQHEQHCAEYATMQRLGVMTRQLAQAVMTAGNQHPYPMGNVSAAQQAQALEGWPAYRRLRVPTLRDDDRWM